MLYYYEVSSSQAPGIPGQRSNPTVSFHPSSAKGFMVLDGAALHSLDPSKVDGRSFAIGVTPLHASKRMYILVCGSEKSRSEWINALVRAGGLLEMPATPTSPTSGGTPSGATSPTASKLDAASTCSVCSSTFTLLRRKKQCVSCGDICCPDCLPEHIPVTGHATPQISCTPCVATYRASQAFPSKRVQELCEEYKQKDGATGSMGAALSATRSILEVAKSIVPAPFTLLVTAASAALQMAENAVLNSSECVDLARRIARLNFMVLGLSAVALTPAVRICAEDLERVVRKAVDLLARFQGKKSQSLLQAIQNSIKFMGTSLLKDIQEIHAELTLVTQDTILGLSIQDQQRLAPPSEAEIRVAIRDELAHVTEELEKAREETGASIESVHAQLQQMLDSPEFSRCPARGAIFKSTDVVLDEPLNLLGKGGFGSVYAGKLYGVTEVAIKMVPTADTAMVEDEIRRTLRVRHTNVVRVFGIVAPDGAQFQSAAVVMERLGESLESVITSKDPPPAHVRLKYMMDIVAGMQRVHDQDVGVVHFDLKAANILLTRDKRHAKIIDFGASQSRTTVAMDLSVRARGTVPYMAPEMLLGSSRPTTACDVYSLAMLLVELWTCKIVWEGIPESAIIAAVKDGQRPMTRLSLTEAQVPEPIIAVIEACWVQDPRDRPSFAQLATLRAVENFHDAPQRVWPAFLQSHEVSSVVVAMRGASVRPSLPPASKFVACTVEQVALTLEQQEIDTTIIDWVKQRGLNGDSLLFGSSKVIGKLRENVAFDEFHVDALERILTHLANQQAEEARQMAKAAALRAEAAEQAKKHADELRRQKEEAEIEAQKAAEIAVKKQAEERKRLEEEERERQEQARKRKVEEEARAAAEAVEQKRRIEAAASSAQVSVPIIGKQEEAVELLKSTTDAHWRFIQQKALEGNPDAMCIVGAAYASGTRVAQDKKQALEYYRRAAHVGHACGQFFLGSSYMRGDNFLPQNNQLSLQWNEKAAMQGHWAACYNTGLIYEHGYGTAPDLPKAAKYYELAAGQNSGWAQYNLGMMMLKGRGVPVNVPKALEYIETSANSGYSEAQAIIAGHYRTGNGVIQSDIKALRYYRGAAAQGHAKSLAAIGQGGGAEADVTTWYRRVMSPYVKNVWPRVSREYLGEVDPEIILQIEGVRYHAGRHPASAIYDMITKTFVPDCTATVTFLTTAQAPGLWTSRESVKTWYDLLHKLKCSFPYYRATVAYNTTGAGGETLQHVLVLGSVYLPNPAGPTATPKYYLNHYRVSQTWSLRTKQMVLYEGAEVSGPTVNRALVDCALIRTSTGANTNARVAASVCGFNLIKEYAANIGKISGAAARDWIAQTHHRDWECVNTYLTDAPASSYFAFADLQGMIEYFAANKGSWTELIFLDCSTSRDGATETLCYIVKDSLVVNNRVDARWLYGVSTFHLASKQWLARRSCEITPDDVKSLRQAAGV